MTSQTSCERQGPPTACACSAATADIMRHPACLVQSGTHPATCLTGGSRAVAAPSTDGMAVPWTCASRAITPSTGQRRKNPSNNAPSSSRYTPERAVPAGFHHQIPRRARSGASAAFRCPQHARLGLLSVRPARSVTGRPGGAQSWRGCGRGNVGVAARGPRPWLCHWAIIAIAPVQFFGQVSGEPTFISHIRDVPYQIIHGSKDGDVSDFQGLRQYDRAADLRALGQTL